MSTPASKPPFIPSTEMINAQIEAYCEVMKREEIPIRRRGKKGRDLLTWLKSLIRFEVCTFTTVLTNKTL